MPVQDTTCPQHGGKWLINGLMWDDITEFPRIGSTEIWSWIDRSTDIHSMHIHLVRLQVLDRQDFTIVNNVIPPTGARIPPSPGEAGWKDTVQTHPGQITRVIQKFETFSGSFPYPCHILEHEDHEMMRQYNLLCTAPSLQTQPAAARTCQGGTLSIATGSYHNTGSYDCLITNPGGEATTIGVFLRFCLSDFNCNGAATVQNIFDFLAGFFASDPRADAHRNGAVIVQDIFDFLSSFFAGCASALVRPTLASFRMIPAGFP